MKPMIKYRGGKSKEIPSLLPYFPTFNGRYIEPFLGGGAMYFHLEPRKAIINDINKKLMGFYAEVRDHYSTLKTELHQLEELYTANRAQFDKLKERNPQNRVEDANEPLYYLLRDMYNGLSAPAYTDGALYYFINKTAYSGMIRYNAKGEYNVPYGRYKHFNTELITDAHHQLLRRTELHNGDYKEVFNMACADDFIFLDPPYDCVFSDYGNEEYKEGFSVDSHKQLASDFRNLPCKALMVIGGTPFIRDLYRGLIVGEYNKSYSVNIRNRFQAAAKHIVITNYK